MYHVMQINTENLLSHQKKMMGFSYDHSPSVHKMSPNSTCKFLRNYAIDYADKQLSIQRSSHNPIFFMKSDVTYTNYHLRIISIYHLNRKFSRTYWIGHSNILPPIPPPLPLHDSQLGF